MAAPVKRGRRGPRRALTEDEILDAALSLLDEGGPTAASVRGIAARVGVAPNAVYTYFPDKAAVVKALVERLLGEVDHGVFADREPAVAATGGSPSPWSCRQRLAAHPGAVPLMIGGPMDGPHALALNERLLELLADAGLDPTDAARAAYLLIVYVFGSIALEVADRHRPARCHRNQNASPAGTAPRRRHRPSTIPAPPQRPTSSPATSPPSSTSGDFTESSTASPPAGHRSGLTRVMPRARDSNSRPTRSTSGWRKGAGLPSSTRPHIKGYGVPA